VSDRRRERVKTGLRTLTRDEVRTAVGATVLSRDEELLVRMRYGLGLGPSEHLEYRGQDHEETRIKLAMMEQALLDELSEKTPADLNTLLTDD